MSQNRKNNKKNKNKTIIFLIKKLLKFKQFINKLLNIYFKIKMQ